MELNNEIQIQYLKFIAIDNSLKDENILEDFYNLDYAPITIDDISFYFSTSRYHWLLKLIENKQLLDTDDKCISAEMLQKYFKEYGKGFRVGFFNYLNKTKNEIELFNNEDEIFINKIFSKVNNALNVSCLPMQANPKEKKSNRKYKILEKSLLNAGIVDGEIYRAWCVIAEYNPKFTNIWAKAKLENIGYEEDRNESILNFSGTKETERIKWKGTPTQFIELVKALVENGSIKGIQKDIITSLSQAFDIEIKNPDKLIQDIKKRNTGSETLFLDDLKSSLYNFITKENIR